MKGDTMEEEQNPQDLDSEESEEVPSLLEVEERLAESEDKAVFACPDCRTEVAADSTNCPGCGAIFEEVPASEDIEDEELPSLTDMDEEKKAYIEPKDVPKEIPQDIPKIDPVINASPPVVVDEEKEYDNGKLTQTMSDYYQRRKKRYLMGALSLGVGIVMFVLLWLVVVNSVLVAETDNVFGLEVIALLAVAAVFFIIGLFLTLTYPSSSLTKLLTSMPMNVESEDAISPDQGPPRSG
jgi:hypothetical protein